MDHRLRNQQPPLHSARQGSRISVRLVSQVHRRKQSVALPLRIPNSVQPCLDFQSLARREEGIEDDFLRDHSDRALGVARVLVDVELRRQLWDYVRSLHEQGVTVVLTTHYLEEAEQLCDRIAIINHGQVIANEPTRELVSKAQEKSVVGTFDRDIAAVPTDRCFENIELIDERTLEITYRKDRVNAGQVLSALTADGLAIVDVSTRDPDLEDVFLSLTSEPQEAA